MYIYIRVVIKCMHKKEDDFFDYIFAKNVRFWKKIIGTKNGLCTPILTTVAIPLKITVFGCFSHHTHKTINASVRLLIAQQ